MTGFKITKYSLKLGILFKKLNRLINVFIYKKISLITLKGVTVYNNSLSN